MKYNNIRQIIRNILIEDYMVKNKRTGSVYSVKNVNPEKHIALKKDKSGKPIHSTPDEIKKNIEKEKSEYSSKKDKSVLGAGSDKFTGPKTDDQSIIHDARKQRYVVRFMNKLNDSVRKAKEDGKPAPNFNMCEISIPGTNLFCQKSIDIPRHEMPQLKGFPKPGSIADKLPKAENGEVDTEETFKKYLIKKGYNLEKKSVNVLNLKASQTELVGAKVVGMTKALENLPPEKTKGITAPIFVSKDGYILDGHHRWAAMVVVAMGKQNLQPPVKMDVIVIDTNAKDMINITNDFTNKIGIQQKSASTNKGN